MTERIGVPFYRRALVGAAALLGALAASYLACEQTASSAPLEVEGQAPEVDVARFAVG